MAQRLTLAGYGVAAEIAVVQMMGRGLKPGDLTVITHALDARNQGLHSLCAYHGLSVHIWEEAKFNLIAQACEQRPDLLISMHFRKRIPLALIEAHRCGGINLHPSLLPMYRGAHSVAWAIINGEHTTGFTYHYMVEAFDEGCILIQESVDVSPDETNLSLFYKQITRGAARLSEAIDKALQGKSGTPQGDGGSYFGRALPFKGVIDPAWDRGRVERFIRALYFPPFSGARLASAAGLVDVGSIDEFDAVQRKPF